MNSISARDSLPERWPVCSDGSSRCASQSANTLQKSSRQQYSAVISTAIEGVSGTGLEAQSSQTDAVKSLIRWESPHPLSIAGVSYIQLAYIQHYILGAVYVLIDYDLGRSLFWIFYSVRSPRSNPYSNICIFIIVATGHKFAFS